MALNSELSADESVDANLRATVRPSLASRFIIVAGGVVSVGMAVLGFWASTIVERSVVSHAAATIAVYVETLL